MHAVIVRHTKQAEIINTDSISPAKCPEARAAWYTDKVSWCDGWQNRPGFNGRHYMEPLLSLANRPTAVQAMSDPASPECESAVDTARIVLHWGEPTDIVTTAVTRDIMINCCPA